jgi:hypothetical protein
MRTGVHLVARHGGTQREEPMGPRLFPAKQVYNLTEVMVWSGAITGDIARRWTGRIEDEEKVARLR